jgi:hypothetical protein
MVEQNLHELSLMASEVVLEAQVFSVDNGNRLDLPCTYSAFVSASAW